MQEGSFRCDANVSVRKRGGEVRHAHRDQERQLLPLRREGDRVRDRAPDRGDRGRRQDRCRRPGCSIRVPARRASCAAKEDANDYRYFLDPDLPAGDRARKMIELREGRDARAAARPMSRAPCARFHGLEYDSRAAHAEPRARRAISTRPSVGRRDTEAREQLGSPARSARRPSTPPEIGGKSRPHRPGRCAARAADRSGIADGTLAEQRRAPCLEVAVEPRRRQATSSTAIIEVVNDLAAMNDTTARRQGSLDEVIAKNGEERRGGVPSAARRRRSPASWVR